MDLAEFLLARIAEDEAAAKEAVDDARPDWVVGCEETSDGDNAFWAVEALGEKSEWFADLGSQPSDHARAYHIARHDPARVLAECESKRGIVEEHSFHVLTPVRWQDDPRPPAPDERRCDTCGSGDENGAGWPCPTLRLLALPYANHSDYQPEWKV